MATHQTNKPDRQKPRWIRSAKLRLILDVLGIALFLLVVYFSARRSTLMILSGNFAPRLNYDGDVSDPVTHLICTGIVVVLFFLGMWGRHKRMLSQGKRGGKRR